jgi:hypothetical protein
MAIMIPFLDLSAPYRELQPEIDAAVARVLASIGNDIAAMMQ